MSSKNKELELQNVEVIDNNVEICVSETYEMMSSANLIFAGVLYVFCIALLSVAVYMSPDPKFVQRRITETEARTKELSLAVRYSDLKYYHRSITFALQSTRPRRQPMIVVISGSIKLRKKGRTIRDLQIEERVYRLPSMQLVPIFVTNKLEINDILADLEITVTDGQFKDMYLVWYHENSSWIFFSILLRSVSFLVCLYLFFHLFTRIIQLKSKSATVLQKFLMYMSLLLAILWIPLSELRFFDLLKSITPILSLLDSLTSAVLVFVFNVICWNLRFRFTSSEVPFIKRSTFSLIIMCSILAIPKAVQFNDTFYQDIIEVWIPVGLIFTIMINMMRFPLTLESQTPEFLASFLHLFYSIPSISIIIFMMISRSERNSKISVFASGLNTISYLFLVLLHWPRDDAGMDAQYVQTDLQNNNIEDFSASDDQGHNWGKMTSLNDISGGQLDEEDANEM